jgi:hypothetical protein
MNSELASHIYPQRARISSQHEIKVYVERKIAGKLPVTFEYRGGRFEATPGTFTGEGIRGSYPGQKPPYQTL